jgi:hypothetical protein
MDTQLLYQFAKFHKMSNLEKRQLFTKLVGERLGVYCEARIYRVLVRLTFQSLRRKYEEVFNFTQDDTRFDALLQELGLSASTAVNWYYTTIRKQPLNLAKNECKDLTTGNICECCISDEVRKKLENNYEYRLASKRLYQIMVRAEIFKDVVAKEGILITEDDLRLSLRRICEHEYYPNRFKRRTRYHLRDIDIKIMQALTRIKLRPITPLRWLYLLRHHPELVRKAQQGQLAPDDIFVHPMQILKNDISQGGVF